MTYACDDCGFLFSRFLSVSVCPLCEGTHIRPSTEEEKKTLYAKLKENNSKPEENGRKAT